MNKKNNAYICPIVFGIVMIIIGLCIKVPGGALTTLSSLNGEKTDYYTFDNQYVSIDEYVGGDAYNYEIGASLVAGRTAGAMTSRSIFIVGGLICVCFGATLMMASSKSEGVEKSDNDRIEKQKDELPERVQNNEIVVKNNETNEQQESEGIDS